MMSDSKNFENFKLSGFFYFSDDDGQIIGPYEIQLDLSDLPDEYFDEVDEDEYKRELKRLNDLERETRENIWQMLNKNKDFNNCKKMEELANLAVLLANTEARILNLLSDEKVDIECLNAMRLSVDILKRQIIRKITFAEKEVDSFRDEDLESFVLTKKIQIEAINQALDNCEK